MEKGGLAHSAPERLQRWQGSPSSAPTHFIWGRERGKKGEGVMRRESGTRGRGRKRLTFAARHTVQARAPRMTGALLIDRAKERKRRVRKWADWVPRAGRDRGTRGATYEDLGVSMEADGEEAGCCGGGLGWLVAETRGFI